MKNSILILILLAGIVILGYLFINKRDENNLIQNEEESMFFEQENNVQTPPVTTPPIQNNNQGSNANTTPVTPTQQPISGPVTQGEQNENSEFVCSNNLNSQGDDINGCHPGLITSVSGSVNNYSLSIDYVILDVCPPLNPEDECLVNNNPMIRNFSISNNATIKTFNENWEPVSISLQNFASNFSTGAGAAPNTLQGGTMYKLNRIKIENGVVVEISPIYLP